MPKISGPFANLCAHTHTHLHIALAMICFSLCRSFFQHVPLSYVIPACQEGPPPDPLNEPWLAAFRRQHAAWMQGVPGWSRDDRCWNVPTKRAAFLNYASTSSHYLCKTSLLDVANHQSWSTLLVESDASGNVNVSVALLGLTELETEPIPPRCRTK